MGVRWFLKIVILCLPMATPAWAADQADLRKLLDDFLAGASVNSVEQHQRFWAEDLIYTSSTGERFDKARIMQGLKSEDNNSPAAVYRAEEVDIRIYNSTAIMAFKLVGELVADGKTKLSYYFNTGTLLKRDGVWKVIAWQATRIPEKK